MDLVRTNRLQEPWKNHKMFLSLDNEISKRISILRYLMIVGIVILHVPPYVPLDQTALDIFSFIKAFFSHGVFRSTVPVLTCISGYLLFSSGLYKEFRTLLKNKTMVLLVPMVIWNLPLVILLYLIQFYEIGSHQFSAKLYPFEWLNWLNGIFGFLAPPVNYPLNFLRDLYILMLLTPIFGFLLRNSPVLGCILVTLVFWNNFDGYLVLRNTMAINFYIGGMAAILKWNLKKLDKYAIWLFIAFMMMCLSIVIFKLGDRKWFVIFAPFLIWPFSAIIVRMRLGNFFAKLSKYSFFLFLSHGPILLTVSLIYPKFFGNLHTPAFWLIAPLIVVSISQLLYQMLAKHTPATLSFALGER